jgi:hypothetical protein
MQFDKVLDTKNKHKGVNKKKYLVIHHTAGGSFEGNCTTLTVGKVSVHYIVGMNGEVAKIGKHDDILWHAGVGTCPDGDTNPNGACIGIEVVSDAQGEGYTEKQKAKVKELVEFIIGKENIPKENIIRHADLTRRKIDIDLSFFAPFNFGVWKSSLSPKKYISPENEALISLAIASNSNAWTVCTPAVQKLLHEANNGLKSLL